jgi:hypothetical protein
MESVLGSAIGTSVVKVKVKFTLVQSMKAQRGS